MPRAEWRTVERPGQFGRGRDKYIEEADERYGSGNWRIVWLAGWKAIDQFAEFDSAILEYEKAYYLYMKDNFNMVKEAIKYREVYDNSETNVQSGINYSIQEAPSNHYQDIAIRRVLARLGYWFVGERDELLHVRSTSKDALGQLLSPGKVPFHFKKLIKKPELEGWWEPGTVESYWQSNKVFQVRSSVILDDDSS